MKKVDARGLDCPKPVIETIKVMDGGAAEIIVIVDNDTASKNVSLLAKKKGYSFAEEKKEDGIYIDLKSDGEKTGEKETLNTKETGEWVLLMASEHMGTGSLSRGISMHSRKQNPCPRQSFF